jgi:hypothetical protein
MWAGRLPTRRWLAATVLLGYSLRAPHAAASSWLCPARSWLHRHRAVGGVLLGPSADAEEELAHHWEVTELEHDHGEQCQAWGGTPRIPLLQPTAATGWPHTP